MRKTIRTFLLSTLLGLVLPVVRAEDGPTDAGLLRVGTKSTPPFAMKADDGTWNGISIDLWREAARELGLQFTLEERGLESLLAGLEDGSLDVAVAALTITAERERVMDFTYPFEHAGLGIAVRREPGASWFAPLRLLFNLRLLTAVSALGLVLFAAGFLVWIFERRKNAEQFGGRLSSGLGSAFWWSAVTMTTVG